MSNEDDNKDNPFTEVKNFTKIFGNFKISSLRIVSVVDKNAWVCVDEEFVPLKSLKILKFLKILNLLLNLKI